MGHWTLFAWMYWGWVASEVGILLLTRTGKAGGNVRDRGSLLILWPTIGLAVSGATMYGETHAHTMLRGVHGLTAAAEIVLAAGLLIRWTAIATLGRAFSANVAIRTHQKLYTGGIFRFVRHPSYTGMMLVFLAVALSTRNWIGMLIMLLPTTAALLYRIRVEEEALCSAFGVEYVNYSRLTKRLVPGIY